MDKIFTPNVLVCFSSTIRNEIMNNGGQADAYGSH